MQGCELAALLMLTRPLCACLCGSAARASGRTMLAAIFREASARRTRLESKDVD